MPPHTHWTHWPNLNTVRTLQSHLIVGRTDLCLQWRRLFEVISQTTIPLDKDKADSKPDVAAAHIMDDDLEGAEAGLANGTSSFHKVCQILLIGSLGSRLIGFGDEECWLMTSALAPIACKGHGCFLKSYAWL